MSCISASPRRRTIEVGCRRARKNRRLSTIDRGRELFKSGHRRRRRDRIRLGCSRRRLVGSPPPHTQEGPEQRQLRPFSHVCRSRSSPVAQTVGSRSEKTRVPSLAASRMERRKPRTPTCSMTACPLDAGRRLWTRHALPARSAVLRRLASLAGRFRLGPSYPFRGPEVSRRTGSSGLGRGNHAAHSAQLMCVGGPCHPIWPAPGLPAAPRLPKSDRKHTPRRSELQRHALAARRPGADRAPCPTTPSATCSA